MLKVILIWQENDICLLYTSDAADDMQCVDLGGRRIIKKNLSTVRREETWPGYK